MDRWTSEYVEDRTEILDIQKSMEEFPRIQRSQNLKVFLVSCNLTFAELSHEHMDNYSL